MTQSKPAAERLLRQLVAVRPRSTRHPYPRTRPAGRSRPAPGAPGHSSPARPRPERDIRVLRRTCADVHPSSWHGRAGLLGRLDLLLGLPDLWQRIGVDDVGHRAERVRLAVVAGRLPPAVGGVTPRRLPSTAVKIAALSAPKPGSVASAASARRRRSGPARCCWPGRRSRATSTWHAWCTRLAIEPGNRWIAGRSRAQRDELLLARRGDRGDVERAAHPLGDHQRPAERLLHRHLLVQDHADQQCVVVLGEQPVGLRVARQPDGGFVMAPLCSPTSATA